MDFFKEWLRERNLDPEALDDETRDVLRAIYYREQDTIAELKRDQRNADGDEETEQARRNLEQYQARSQLILGTARAMVATADDKTARTILDFAAGLVDDTEVGVGAVPGKLAERLQKITAEAGDAADPTPARTRDFAAARNPDEVLSKRDIIAAFGEVREDFNVYQQAARSVAQHQASGCGFAGRELLDELDGRTATLIVHEGEDRGAARPRRRAIQASAANVAIQFVLNTALDRIYEEVEDDTSMLTTQVPASPGEGLIPEVNAGSGVARIREGEPYPMVDSTERSLKTSYVKVGGALTQTRENSVMDALGRYTRVMQGIVQEAAQEEAAFRLARVCGSTAWDGRYVAYYDDNNGASDFYSISADTFGNVNLIESNGLDNETDLDNVFQQFGEMQRANGVYVNPRMRVLLGAHQKRAAYWKILNAVYAPSVTTNANIVNPFGPQGMLDAVPTLITHPLVSTYAGEETTWYAGDPARQFVEVVYWNLEFTPVMTSGEMELRDIVSAWKASWCKDIVADGKMFVVKCTA
jgi:hypothetical protein